jgi:hypothetical protein
VLGSSISRLLQVARAGLRGLRFALEEIELFLGGMQLGKGKLLLSVSERGVDPAMDNIRSASHPSQSSSISSPRTGGVMEERSR